MARTIAVATARASPPHQKRTCFAAYFAAPSWMHAASFVERTKMRPPLSTGVVQHLPSMALKRPSSL